MHSAGDMQEPPAHGGDLAEAAALFPLARQPFVDLSTGINPEAYPLPPLGPDSVARLPSKAALLALEEAARKAYLVSPAAGLVAAPGTQILIELLPRLVPHAEVAILGPTYAEHAHAWAKNGFRVRIITKLEEAADAEIVVLVNPNNPDGNRFEAAHLVRFAGHLAQRGGTLVVDEAFADLEPEALSLAPSLPENAILLRSFGKTYGLAGLRLGFLIAAPAFAATMRAALGPWAVSGPAIAAGLAALPDAAWRERVIGLLDRRGAAIDAAFAAKGISLRGIRLYRFLEHPRAPAIFQRFGEAGLYIRRFAGRPDALRLGIPTEADLPRLITAIDAL